MSRMRILSASEQASIELPPSFDSAERKRYFDFSQSVIEAAQNLPDPANRIGFLLAYGYFRATRRFFSPAHYHARDIAYVSRKLDLPHDIFTPKNYAKATRFRHQKLVLDLQGFPAPSTLRLKHH